MSKEITPDKRLFWAEKLGINEQYLYQCLTGRRNMNPTEARRIETESKGAITRQMICRETWQGIWPELAKSKARAGA
jgi:DNA-binding transcriptional regulator YdaS (Cro superfamily)